MSMNYTTLGSNLTSVRTTQLPIREGLGQATGVLVDQTVKGIARWRELNGGGI